MLLLAACQTPNPDTGAEPEGVDPSDVLQGLAPTNVVVLHTDTLRWDHTPWYGYARDTFPRLSARAGWVRWERMYAQSGWTVPSSTSMLTGVDIVRHGVRLWDEEAHDTLRVTPLAEAWRDAGYATLFISGNSVFETDAELAGGYDPIGIYEDEPGNSSVNVEAALAAIDTAGGPFVLHVQAFDPHAPWSPQPEDLGTWSDLDTLLLPLPQDRDLDHEQRDVLLGELHSDDPARIAAVEQSVIDLYDEELLGLDRSLDALLAGLEERGLAEDTLVVFTADHGETLFDRGIDYGHGQTLYEEQVRVPMVFYNPLFTDASVDGCLGSTMDLHPTLMEAAGVPIPPDLDGRPLTEGCRPVVTATIFRVQDDGEVALTEMTAATTRYKLLHPCGGKAFRYDLDSDPLSTNARGIDAPAFDTLTDALDGVETALGEAWPGMSCP